MNTASDRSSLAGAPAALGTVYVLAFLLLANANAVFAGWLLQSLHPFTFLFWSFSATSMIFIGRLVAMSGLKGLAVDRASLRPLVTLNVTSSVAWLGYFYALRYIEPAIVSALMGGIGPLSTIGLERLVRRRRLTGSAYVAAAGILSGAILLAWASLSGRSGLAEITVAAAVIGLTAAAIGGTAQALTTIATKQLGNLGWDAPHIMAHRFYLLILMSALLAASGPGFAVALPGQTAALAIATLFGVVVPLWALQRGIILSEPFTVAALLSLAPLLTYAFQSFDARIDWSAASAAGCFLMTAFIFYSFRVRYT